MLNCFLKIRCHEQAKSCMMIKESRFDNYVCSSAFMKHSLRHHHLDLCCRQMLEKLESAKTLKQILQVNDLCE